MDAKTVIASLGLEPHPEGGRYAETWADRSGGTRGALTAIYYLLEEGQRSAPHKVDADEVWLWHLGAPLELVREPEGEGAEAVVLGPDLAAGQRPQLVVPKGVWQSARSLGAYTLVSCVVAPGFTFEGFALKDRPAGVG